MSQDLPVIRLLIALDDVAEILAEIRALGGPNKEGLAAAPLIDIWQPLLTPAGELRLTGHVTGHPMLGRAARWVVTSQLIHLDMPNGWCRTASRFYRIGRLSEVRGIDLPPAVRWPVWARTVDVDQLGPLLDLIAAAADLANGID